MMARVPITVAEAEHFERIWRAREATRRVKEQQRHEARAEVAERLMRRAARRTPATPTWSGRASAPAVLVRYGMS